MTLEEINNLKVVDVVAECEKNKYCYTCKFYNSEDDRCAFEGTVPMQWDVELLNYKTDTDKNS